MNDIKVFENKEFGTVRTDMDENGKILFCGNDVAKALGYTNPRKAIADHCITDGVTKRYMVTQTTNQYGMTSRQLVGANFIDEGNLYRLIVHSKLPNAVKFERWVFDEVLPDIRKHGMYMTGEKMVEMMADPDKALEMLIDYAKERKERLRLEQVVKQQQPKVEFADAVNSSKDGILVKQMANLLTRNGYSTGQNRLFKQLRQDGFICSADGERFNTPTQKAIDMGLMITRESHYDCCGVTRLSFTPLITPRGQRYFLGKYANAIVTDEEIKEMLAEDVTEADDAAFN